LTTVAILYYSGESWQKYQQLMPIILM